MTVDTRDRPGRRRVVRFGRRLAVLAAASACTVLLAQHTTTAAFTAGTANGGNQATTATTFCTTPGTDVVTTGEDTVSNGTAGQTTTPNGSATTMPVGISTAAAGYAYIRFDLATAAPARPRCTVTAASLTLYAGTSQAATMDVFRAASTWSAATLTWANQPAYTGDPVSVVVGGVAGDHVFPVRDHVRAFYAGSNLGFVVKDQANSTASTRYQIYNSFNHGTASLRPELTITWG
jgi:hypothetical protein